MAIAISLCRKDWTQPSWISKPFAKLDKLAVPNRHSLSSWHFGKFMFFLSGLSLLVLYVNVCVHKLIHPCCVTAKIVKKHNEILMTAKAYNNRCILEWLAHVLGQARVNAADDRISMMFLAMMLAQTDRGCLCWKATNSCLRAVVPRHAFWQRNSMARFMGMLERAGRFLPLGKTNAACVPV